jgi:hypothetical protein
MGKVFTHMTMSLDEFIADPNDQVGELFDWYGAGDVTVPTRMRRFRSKSTTPVRRCYES